MDLFNQTPQPEAPPRQLTRKEQGERMVKWFEGKPLPHILQHIQGHTFNDPKHWVAINSNTLLTLDDKSPMWELAYNRLYQVKKYLESQVKNTH